MPTAKAASSWSLPRTCRRGHLLMTEADVIPQRDRAPRCRFCHTDTVRRQRAQYRVEHKRPKADPAPVPAPRPKASGPISSIPADADIVRVWAECNGLPFASWRDLPAVNAARRERGRLEFEAST
jgi:hypothetical protein